MKKEKFLVPDYYMDFHCKMGDCRCACCQGWPVSVDREKYFQLLGAECEPELRRRLDCAMYLCDYPTPEAYARLNHRWDGDCVLRDPDGRCGLQVRLGEEILPDVCRLYPRGIRRNSGGWECSCANSCEAVPELFLRRKDPISFEERELELSPPRFSDAADSGQREEEDLRRFFLEILQDRALPLPRRLMRLGGVLEKYAEGKDPAQAEEALPQIPSPSDSERREALGVIRRIAETLREHSDSGIEDYIQTVLARYDSCEDPEALYEKQKRDFDQLLPDSEIFFEHLLVNHLFFARFPFREREVDFRDQFCSLVLIYALLRFLCPGCAPESEEAVADLVAAAFRLIDHTDFERYACRLLKKEKFAAPAQLWALLCL